MRKIAIAGLSVVSLMAAPAFANPEADPVAPDAKAAPVSRALVTDQASNAEPNIQDGKAPVALSDEEMSNVKGAGWFYLTLYPGKAVRLFWIPGPDRYFLGVKP